jgi:hypothetical protein
MHRSFVTVHGSVLPKHKQITILCFVQQFVSKNLHLVKMIARYYPSITETNHQVITKHLSAALPFFAGGPEELAPPEDPVAVDGCHCPQSSGGAGLAGASGALRFRATSASH